jgi:hypothetical protein
MAGLCRSTQDTAGEMHALVELAGLPGADYADISQAAARVTSLLSSGRLRLDTDEKEIVLRKLIKLMEARLREADATDFSRLAWLYLLNGEEFHARNHTTAGLRIEPDNEHCLNLAERLHR